MRAPKVTVTADDIAKQMMGVSSDVQFCVNLIYAIIFPIGLLSALTLKPASSTEDSPQSACGDVLVQPNSPSRRLSIFYQLNERCSSYLGAFSNTMLCVLLDFILTSRLLLQSTYQGRQRTVAFASGKCNLSIDRYLSLKPTSRVSTARSLRTYVD